MTRVLALSGGIGGAKLALGLYRVLPPDGLVVVAPGTELDVLPLWRELPIEGRWNVFALEGVGQCLSCEQAAAVHPRPEICRHCDIGRGGDDTGGKIRCFLGELIEQRTKPRLGRGDRRYRNGELGRNIDARSPVTLFE